MKEMFVLNLVQNQGTNQIVTPLLILDPSVKQSVDDLMKDVVIVMDKLGISTSKTVRENIFKLFDTCCELSNMTRRRIYIDEAISFSVTQVYQITEEDEVQVLGFLTDFKEKIK
jgi:thymidine kinase